MRRVLLTFLGTNDYIPCHYMINGQALTPTRFVQTSIGEVYGRDWNEHDRVIVFLTKEAKRKNWQDNDKPDLFEKEGLESAFGRIVPHLRVETVDISDGQSEKDYWQLFSQVMDCIEAGDEIFFDITHGFRSIPMMALIILNYAKVIKQARLGKVLYGCFEVLGPAYQVRKMPMDERLAPVIDLTEMMALFNWTQGVDNFLRSSDASLIKELTQAKANPILSATRGQDVEAKNLGALANQLDRFTKSLATVRANSLGEEIRELKRVLAASREIEIETGQFRPLEQLMERIEEKVNRFSGDVIMDMYEAAHWCLEHGLVQQGYTFLQESLFTSVCFVLGYSIDDVKVRKMVSEAFNQVTNPRNQERTVENEELALIKRRAIELLSEYRDHLRLFGKLTERRNNINHAGLNKGNLIKADQFEVDLNDLIQSLKPFFEAMQARVNEKTVFNGD